MNIAQVERFYEEDKEKYNVYKNKELLSWLKKMNKEGYTPSVSMSQLQMLIDNIAYWYEMKFPEREMECSKGVSYFNFENIESLSKIMDIEQLMFRLPREQLGLLECNYRSNGGGIRSVYDENGKIIYYRMVLYINIYNKNKKDKYTCDGNDTLGILLCADKEGGKVIVNSDLECYTDKSTITLDELLKLFKEKYSDVLDYSELERCVFIHDCDMELRRRILQMAALKLLYSLRTLPENGYERAKKFILDFNDRFDLKLSTYEIDEIISREYSNQCVTAWYNKNNSKTGDKKVNGVKKLVKTVFKK